MKHRRWYIVEMATRSMAKTVCHQQICVTVMGRYIGETNGPPHSRDCHSARISRFLTVRGRVRSLPLSSPPQWSLVVGKLRNLLRRSYVHQLVVIYDVLNWFLAFWNIKRCVMWTYFWKKVIFTLVIPNLRCDFMRSLCFWNRVHSAPNRCA